MAKHLDFRVFHRARCPFCRRLRAYLAEKGLELDLVDFVPEEHRSTLVALNPKAQVPTCEVSTDLVLFGSFLIMEYLEETHPEPRLMPEDPQLRARTRVLFDIADTLMGADLPAYTRAPLDAPERRKHHDALISHANLTEGWLCAESDLALGDSFTFADLSVPPLVYRAIEAGLDRSLLSPRIRRWCDAALERPTLRALYPDV